MYNEFIYELIPTETGDSMQGEKALNMLTERHGAVAEVNLHGMTEAEAKRQLEQYLSRADASLKEVVVIHGYNNGQVLRDMVRLRLKHPRISAKLISLNPGATRLLLK